MITKRPRAGWSLRTGLLLSFGLSTLFLYCLAQALIVFGVPHTSFKGLWASQTQAAADVLDTMADTRKSQLERWVFERRGDVQSITENPLLQAAVQTILQPPSLAHEAEAELALTRLRLYLHRVRGSHYGEYSRLEIIDPSGKILVSSRPEDEGKTTSPPPYFSKALNPAEEEVVANEPDDDGGKTPDLVFARGIHTPAEGGATSTLAVLVLHNTMDSIISSLLHEGLGHSGEIVIVDQDSRLMAPLRYPLADGSMAQPLVFINPAKPAALAAQGIETMIEALDYRGVEVLAVTRHLRITSELAWGLEIKIDASEIHQPIRQAIIAHALVIAGALLAGIVLTMLLAAWLSTPLVSLSQAAVAIAAGDLSVRTTPAGSREMQNLARFFNIMIQRLEDWHRDLAAEVEKRTTQLTITNQALLASEARYRRIVETSGEGIWVTEADYLTSFINPQ